MTFLIKMIFLRKSAFSLQLQTGALIVLEQWYIFTNQVDVIKSAKEDGLTVILVHEQNVEKEGARFASIDNTPEEFLYPPFNIFVDIAIPLFKRDEFHKISLLLILKRRVFS